MLRRIVLSFCVLPLVAEAEIFKCVGVDGHTSYSERPCPPGGGTTTLMDLTPPEPPAVRLSPSLPGLPALPDVGLPQALEIPGPQLPPPGAANATARMQLALDWVAASYPFLDLQSPQADPQAIQQFMLLQNQSVSSGADQADALVSAARLVASQYRGRPAGTSTGAGAASPAEGEGLTVIQLGVEEEQATAPVSAPPVIAVPYYGRPGGWHEPHSHPPVRPHPPHEEEEEPRRTLRGIPVQRDD